MAEKHRFSAELIPPGTPGAAFGELLSIHRKRLRLIYERNGGVMALSRSDLILPSKRGDLESAKQPE